VLGFLLHEGTKDTKVFLGSIARVYLTTEYTEHTERHSSAVSREGAKVGGRESPRAAFRCAEGWEGRASLVRGQADACPVLSKPDDWTCGDKRYSARRRFLRMSTAAGLCAKAVPRPTLRPYTSSFYTSSLAQSTVVTKCGDQSDDQCTREDTRPPVTSRLPHVGCRTQTGICNGNMA
jgi:hypothetical protein